MIATCQYSLPSPPRDLRSYKEHQQFFSQHFVKKGTEIARACLETLASLKKIDAK
jgi:6,7-dimethyl-8-ribityllumazine synthase